MEIKLSPRESAESRLINQLGFYSSLIAFTSAAGYCISQILQVVGFVKFPVDAYLIYGFSLGMAVPYVIAVISVHHRLPTADRLWSHLALVFAIMYATYANLNYVVQLTTVIPAALQESLDEIRVLDQTPNSLFWDIDALGYICMGLSTFSLGLAISPEWKWLRRFLFANGLIVPVISFVYFYPHFSTSILLVGLPWVITAPGSLLLLAVYFRTE